MHTWHGGDIVHTCAPTSLNHFNGRVSTLAVSTREQMKGREGGAGVVMEVQKFDS
jgi:hypothetical protein